MKPIASFYYVAQTNGYNCGAYGEGNYNECATVQNGGGGTTGDGTGGNTSTGAGSGGTASGVPGWLADTGYEVLVPIALAGAILIASLILVVKRLRRRAA